MEIFNLDENVNIQTEIKFQNTIIRNNQSAEQRIIEHKNPIRRFTFFKNIISPTILEDLRNFHSSVKGAKETFLYLDKSDYKASANANINLYDNCYSYGLLNPAPDGVRKIFQLCKLYVCKNNWYFRSISNPFNLSLKRNNLTVTGWILGDGGRITFASAPAAGVSADFDFFVPVRFESDNFEDKIVVRYDNNQKIYSLERLTFQEVKVNLEQFADQFNQETGHTFQLDLYKGATTITQYSTEIETQSSGFEDRKDKQDNPLFLFRLQEKRILNQAQIEYLIALYLCCKGEGSQFLFEDKVTEQTYQARFNNNSLNYLNQSANKIYQIQGLELRVFIEGVLIDEGYNGWQGNLLSLCQIFQIKIKNRVQENGDEMEETILSFTTHDRNLTIDEIVYQADKTLSPSTIEAKIDLSADNQEIRGILSIDIVEDAIFANVFKSAELIIAVVDWRDLPENLEDIEDCNIQYGVIGEVRSSGTYFVFEYLTKPASLLRTSRVIKASPNCRYKFADKYEDNLCKIDPEEVSYITTVGEVDDRRRFEINQLESNLNFGTITFLSGKNTGISVTIYDVIDTNRVILYTLLPFLPEDGDRIKVMKGCRKIPGDCKSFNNFINYGGEEDLPGNDFYLSTPIKR